MRFWLIIKIIAALAVAGVVGFTGMLTYHITVKPLGGILWGVFETIVPEAGNILQSTKEEEFAKILDAAEMPDFEPGERAFQKAHELIAIGKIQEGREKMLSIVNTFPSSPAAPTARRIVSQMNLDEILSSDFPDGKTEYEVKRGDSYFAIAGRGNTSLDMIMHLNGMMELKSLQPGDKLLLMPLNFRILIEPQRNSISLWDGPKFVCEYPILRLNGPSPTARKTVLASRRASLDGRTAPPTDKNYRAASKSLQLKSPSIQIFPLDRSDESPPQGIFLSEADIEELFLLTRTGNEVEIRSPKK